MDAKTFWREQRALKARLDGKYKSGFLFVIALDGPGVITEVDTGNAARVLQARTHREATQSEISDFRAAAERNKAASIAADLRHNPMAELMSSVRKGDK